jgi:hypothetical protein
MIYLDTKLINISPWYVNFIWDRRGRDRMIVGFTTAYARLIHDATTAFNQDYVAHVWLIVVVASWI